MREITKEVVHTVDGEETTFRIKKMNALHGSYLLKFCAEKLLPVFKGIQSMFQNTDVDELKTEEQENKAIAEQTDEVFSLLPAALASISEDELFKFETRCLQTVEIKLTNGWMSIMSGDHFNVTSVEYDAMAVLMLCYDVLKFNLSGFFGEGSLGSLLLKLNT